MKKTRLLFLMLLLVVSIGMQAQSGTYEANGVTWKFEIADGKATITGETQGASAFHGALNIPSTVQLGSQSYTVDKIGNNAFYGYEGATSITIPDNTQVGDNAFYSCWNIESLTLGSNVKGESEAFFSCSKLNSTNIHYPSGELKGIIETGLLGRLSWITGNVEIPEGTTKIGESCFLGCKELTNVTIPASVQEIGKEAFYGCKELTNVTIPTSVQKIGASAFYGCASLPSVTLPEGLEEIAGGTFDGCKELTNVTIPTSVKKIGWGAFVGCTSLPSVTLPDGLEEIVDNTFINCIALTNVTIPTSVKKIGVSAFSGCTSLPSVTLPAGLEEIANYAFSGCTALTSITIPTSVQKIGREAFKGCTSLPSVTLPDGLEEIANYAFFGCSALTNVTIPSVQKIGERAFSGCASLPSVTLPEGLEEIAGYAFDGCTSLTSITIPTGVKKIGVYAFNGCTNLTEPHEFHCDYIGDAAFAGTGITGDVYIDAKVVRGFPDKATKITFSGRVEQIDNSGNYEGLPALEELVFEPSDKPLKIGETPFRNATKLKWLDLTARVVPESSEELEPVYLYHPSHEAMQFISEYSEIPCKPFALYYFPDNIGNGSTAWAVNNLDEPNLVWKGKCRNFEVYDTYNYPIIHPFTAVKASYDREFSVTDGKAVSTLYLPYPTYLPEGMMAYTLVKKGVNGEGEKSFIFREVPTGTRLEANKPYLVQITDGQTHKLPVMENVEVPVTPTIEATAQQATADADWKFYGTTAKISNAEAYAKKAYYLNDNKWWAVQNGEENDYIAPFRCFVSSPTGAAPAKSFALVLGNGSETTDIDALESSTESDIRSGKYPFYGVDGKMMGRDYDKLERGQIYVVNGKKFYKF